MFVLFYILLFIFIYILYISNWNKWMLVLFLIPSAECVCEVFDVYFYSVTDA